MSEDVDAAWVDLWHDVANGEWSEVGRVDHHQRAIEAAIRAQSSGLDAERLARAMKGAEGVAWPNLWTVQTENLDWVARQVAAEYARLTEAER